MFGLNLCKAIYLEQNISFDYGFLYVLTTKKASLYKSRRCLNLRLALFSKKNLHIAEIHAITPKASIMK